MWTPLLLIVLASSICVTARRERTPPAYLGSNATALRRHALTLMDDSPLIDTHVDLPQILRALDREPLSVIDSLAKNVPGHTDIRKMKEGHSGGAFMSVWAPCPDMLGMDVGPDFLIPDNSVRDALEMFDLIQQMTLSHPNDAAPAYTSGDILKNHKEGRLSFLIGIEGAHMLGNSLSTLRMYAQLGARYLTLTHTCHNSFASSAGAGGPMTPVHHRNGLSSLGRELISELNRLGMMVDLSHVSDEVMEEAIAISKAPVIFSHSGARSIHSHPRNVPDHIVQKIGSGSGQNPGIILSVFYPPFINDPELANVADVADHIEHIADITGRAHVGIASDFDGMYASVKGLETAREYPNLVIELLHRGWTDAEIKGVMGLNLLRVMDEVDAVKQQLSHKAPSRVTYSKREDLPARWGGPGDAYWPTEVAAAVTRKIRDEL